MVLNFKIQVLDISFQRRYTPRILINQVFSIQKMCKGMKGEVVRIKIPSILDNIVAIRMLKLIILEMKFFFYQQYEPEAWWSKTKEYDHKICKKDA